MFVFDIKITPWSYFYATFNFSNKFVHFLPITFMLISLKILTLYACLYYCQKLVNFYWKSGQCVCCHATYLYKKISCSSTWISLFSNKKNSASLSIYKVVQIWPGLIFFCSHNPYPTAFPYGNGMVLHFYQQQESSTTKTVHKVINKGLKTYV